MKYLFIQEHRSRFRVEKMCRVFAIARSGYYAWMRREKSTRQKENEQLLGNIKNVYLLNRQVYGSPRIAAALHAQGIRCGKNRIARLMSRNGIKARTVKRYRITTKSKHRFPVAPNIVDREFTARAADRLWVSDITYIGTREGWLYLAVVIDLFSRQVVGFAMSERMTRALVIDALRMAWFRRRPAVGLIFHSDRGSQYASSDFQKQLSAFGMRGSMSRKGDCWDNAVTETLFGSLKVERLHGMRFETRRQAKDEVIDWLRFYNCRRLHSTLGYLSPMDFEKKRLVEKERLVA